MYRSRIGRGDFPDFRFGVSSNRGLSIIEVVVSLLIVALGIIGFGMAIPVGRDNVAILSEKRAALTLGTQMMEEIQTKRFEEDPDQADLFGRESGEGPNRATFDDVDDYDNWNASPPQFPDGTVMNGQDRTPDYSNFRRTVVVENVDDDNYGMVTADGATAAKRIVVTVSSENTPPSFPDMAITGVVAREGIDLLYGSL
ncbi:MAG: hypothetical protein JXD19_06160, partial [Deltaproteobacteria bacterium]|nr:hypothetical protein [Deltaproteobacteria bacterium]